jgi:hypothetical protein
VTVKKTVTVTHEGFDFEVSGDWEPPTPGTMYNRHGDPGDPSDGGYFEDSDILLNGKSIYELLAPEAIDAIMDKAKDAVTD